MKMRCTRCSTAVTTKRARYTCTCGAPLRYHPGDLAARSMKAIGTSAHRAAESIDALAATWDAS